MGGVNDERMREAMIVECNIMIETGVIPLSLLLKIDFVHSKHGFFEIIDTVGKCLGLFGVFRA